MRRTETITQAKEEGMNKIIVGSILILSLVGTSAGCGKGGDSTGTANVTVTGSWEGNWSSTRGVGGAVTASMDQSGSSLNGDLELKSSPCFSKGTLTGSVTGTTVLIGTAFGGGQTVDFDGTATEDGKSMSGKYSVKGGLCGGDTGTWSMNRTATTLK
jgi:hypothetical protein